MRRHSHNLKLHSNNSPQGIGGDGSGGGGATEGVGDGAVSITSTSAVNRERIERIRNRSDSETLSDEPILESNDEGIGTDHIDEKIEDGEIRSAKELELYMGSELIESGKNLLATIEPCSSSINVPVPLSTSTTTSASGPETVTMAQLQLPSIVIQTENGDRAMSPVSSRSESPIRYVPPGHLLILMDCYRRLNWHLIPATAPPA